VAIPASPTQQATGTGTTTSTTTTVTLGATPANGCTLFAIFTVASNLISVSGIAQTNVTWSKVRQSNTNNDCELWMGVAAQTGTIGTSVVYTHTILTGAARAAVSEWPGTLTLDTSGTNTGATNSDITTGSFTPTAARNALFIMTSRNAGTFGSVSPWTNFNTANAGSQSAYLVVQSTTGSYSGTWSMGGVSAAWDNAWGAFVQSVAPAADHHYRQLRAG
jgi:hypothetical protein